MRKLSKAVSNNKNILFVSSGLGGMSGAQALAAVICGVTAVIAEVDPDAVRQRLNDGYIMEANVYSDLSQLALRVEEERVKESAGVALIYHGNVVDLWAYFDRQQIPVDLGSDQTSLHNIEDLGYCPKGIDFDTARKMLMEDKPGFMRIVRKSLREHVQLINQHAERGMYFWDYGNAFLKEAAASNADIYAEAAKDTFRYRSYVEDIMGPYCFDFGFGPFRWVCCSGKQEDLDTTDRIAERILKNLREDAPPEIQKQLDDNINWICSASDHIPGVGSMSRILYADARGRKAIALAFNQAIKDNKLSGPVVLGRDHHDVSGTDSPFRETSNIYDGSKFTADMAVHNVIGDACRGATWVSLHNGGGVGWGEVINGGFGLVLDGSTQAKEQALSMLDWDVHNGIARRAWAQNDHAVWTAKQAMVSDPYLKITLAQHISHEKLNEY